MTLAIKDGCGSERWELGVDQWHGVAVSCCLGEKRRPSIGAIGVLAEHELCPSD